MRNENSCDGSTTVMVLGILLYRAFILRYTSRRSYCLSGGIAIIAGIIDERIIQYLLPMRVYDFTDILLNATGVIIGAILIFAYNSPVYGKAS